MIGSIRNAVVVAALLSSAGSAGCVWWIKGANSALRADNAALHRSVAMQASVIAQREEAARVAAARAARWEERASELDATIETVLTADFEECADAQLDPALADLLRRLRATD